MNYSLFAIGLADVAVSTLTGIAIIVVAFRFLNKMARIRYGIDPNGTPWAVFQTGMILALGILLSELSGPVQAALNMLRSENISTPDLLTEMARYILLCAGMGGLLGAFLIVSGILLYSSLTHEDEFVAMREGRWQVALVCSAVMIVLSLLAGGGLHMMYRSLLPWPELPMIR